VAVLVRRCQGSADQESQQKRGRKAHRSRRQEQRIDRKKRRKKERTAQERTGPAKEQAIHWLGSRRFDGFGAIGHAGGIRRAWLQACRARASRRHRALLLELDGRTFPPDGGSPKYENEGPHERDHTRPSQLQDRTTALLHSSAPHAGAAACSRDAPHAVCSARRASRCALCCTRGLAAAANAPRVSVVGRTHALSSAHSPPRTHCPAANTLLSRAGQTARSASSKWPHVRLSSFAGPLAAFLAPTSCCMLCCTMISHTRLTCNPCTRIL
jgi:hypothetical protein